MPSFCADLFPSSQRRLRGNRARPVEYPPEEAARPAHLVGVARSSGARCPGASWELSPIALAKSPFLLATQGKSSLLPKANQVQ